MKHKIVAAVCIAVIVTLAVIGVSTWHTEQVQEHVKAAKAYAAQQYHDQLQKAAVAAEKRRVNDLCHSDQNFYDTQTPVYKKANPRPECDLKLAE